MYDWPASFETLRLSVPRYAKDAAVSARASARNSPSRHLNRRYSALVPRPAPPSGKSTAARTLPLPLREVLLVERQPARHAPTAVIHTTRNARTEVSARNRQKLVVKVRRRTETSEASRGFHSVVARLRVVRRLSAACSLDLRTRVLNVGDSGATRSWNPRSRPRRDDRGYRLYSKEEQRRPRAYIARRTQTDFHHGLLGPIHR